MDFVRAIGEPQRALACVGLGEAEVAGHAATAVRLDGVLPKRAQNMDGWHAPDSYGWKLAAMQRLTVGAFDVVFLDPPFDGPWFEPALQAAVSLVPVGGWIYLEAPVAWAAEALDPLHLTLQRHLKAGAVHAHLLRRTA